MKNTILTTALIILNLLCTSQNDTAWFDSNFKPIDKARAIYYRPYPKKEGNNYRVLDYYKSGKLQGSALSAYPDKEFWVGTMYGFFVTGDTAFITEYENNLPNGRAIQYSEPGKKRVVANYNKGVLSGFYGEYYQDGHTHAEGIYNNGIQLGNWKVYDYDAHLLEEYTITDDKLTGSYYKRAPLSDENFAWLVAKGNFANGNLVDYSMYLDDEKKPRVTAVNINGTEEWKYYTGDTLILECYYKNNKRTGEWKRYSLDGKSLVETITYENDNCTSQLPVDLKKLKKGIVLPQRFSGLLELEFKCSKGKVRRYDKTGRLILSETFSLGTETVDSLVEDVPHEIRYPDLIRYYTFWYDRDYDEGEEITISLADEKFEMDSNTPPPPPFLGEEAIVTESEWVKDEDPVFTFVEQLPEFPGGDEALAKFFKTNFIYPKALIGTDIQGRVIIRFVVRTTGAIDNVSILRGVDADIDKEVLRVAQMLPLFKPGRQQGKAVNVYYNFTVQIELPVK